MQTIYFKWLPISQKIALLNYQVAKKNLSLIGFLSHQVKWRSQSQKRLILPKKPSNANSGEKSTEVRRHDIPPPTQMSENRKRPANGLCFPARPYSLRRYCVWARLRWPLYPAPPLTVTMTAGVSVIAQPLPNYLILFCRNSYLKELHMSRVVFYRWNFP